jgi:hypothetical protein
VTSPRAPEIRRVVGKAVTGYSFGGQVAAGDFQDNGPADLDPNSGSVFLFGLGTGSPEPYSIEAPTAEPGDELGASVALSGNLMVLGGASSRTEWR